MLDPQGNEFCVVTGPEDGEDGEDGDEDPNEDV
jgi:hypothetical protein